MLTNRRITFMVVALSLMVVCAWGDAASITDVKAWLDEAGLKYATGTDDDGSTPAYLIPFDGEESGLDRIDVFVKFAGETHDYVVVFAKLAEVPANVDASVYQQLLEANAQLHLARLAIVDGGLFFIHECILRITDKDHLLAMIADVARFVDASYADVQSLLHGERSSHTPRPMSGRRCREVARGRPSTAQPPFYEPLNCLASLPYDRQPEA